MTVRGAYKGGLDNGSDEKENDDKQRLQIQNRSTFKYLED